VASTPPAAVPSEVTEILQRMREAMPSDLAYSHYGHNILNSMANELSRVEEALRLWFAGQFVATTSGEHLSRLEAAAGLSVNPEGFTVDQRRERLTAHLSGRFNYVGSDFLKNLSRLAYGSIPSISVNTTTGTATLTFAVGLTSAEVNRIIIYCEESGPAHYQWEINSDDASSGLVVNVGKVGFTKI